MGQVVDLLPMDSGMIVHLRLLPGAVEDYHAAIERFIDARPVGNWRRGVA